MIIPYSVQYFRMCTYRQIYSVPGMYVRSSQNRMRLPNLLVVSWAGKMDIPLSPFVPEIIWSRETGSAVPSPASVSSFILHDRPESGAYFIFPLIILMSAATLVHKYHYFNLYVCIVPKLQLRGTLLHRRASPVQSNECVYDRASR